MRWPFNRKKNIDGVPAEIQEYYQTERRERTGIAWLLALGTLIITIGLATALFFGGRWVYQTVFDDDTQETAQNDDGQEAEKAPEGKPEESAGPSTGTSSTNTSTPNSPSTPTQGATTPSSGTQSATTTPLNSDLPNTGPGDVVALFAATALAASAAHYAFTHRSEQ